MTYTFNDKRLDGPVTKVTQRGWVNKANPRGTEWQVQPWIGLCYLPFRLAYMIIDIDATDYTYMTASSPSTTQWGKWLYIMTRRQEVDDAALEPLRKACAAVGWDMSQAIRVPQRGNGGAEAGEPKVAKTHPFAPVS